MNLTEFMKIYRSRIDGILQKNVENLPKLSEVLAKAMGHGLLLGGKRVRPFLVYATGHMLGASDEIMDGPAAAIECIHAYSLIHDDLPCMDDDELRRGKPTVHILYGEAQGMLAGDALQTLGFEILSHHDMPDSLLKNQLKMLSLLSSSSGYSGMCGGQSLDLISEDHQVPLEQLEQIHRHKTGALIECAVLMGALCVPSIEEKFYINLKKYAQAIGLAFQVHDDILDIISDTETLGKPQGSDIANSKSTYPALMGLDKAMEYEKKLYEDALANLAELPYDTSVLKEFAEFIISRKS